MEIVRDIVDVRPLPDYKVWVRFETGEKGVFDCTGFGKAQPKNTKAVSGRAGSMTPPQSKKPEFLV